MSNGAVDVPMEDANGNDPHNLDAAEELAMPGLKKLAVVSGAQLTLSQLLHYSEGERSQE
jgi:hypothetical protein